ncbi:tail protein X [Zooshikella harenae]|uniref:Tail protein X n=1 Tax=Zooshikella harenae TaxID=2827238 RepID=A0ABS5ZCW1_9GAMM|nr:tail protein X [Zooshikella harenae]MBU2711845.1 tail protein X [Zooshikella harenae]
MILAEQAKQQGKVIYWTQGEDTVDRIAWKVCGQTEGITELIFEENYGLVNLGVYLPENIPVIIPNISNVDKASGQVVLWQ